MLNRLLKLFTPAAAPQEPPPGHIDARRLMAQHTVEEFNEAAEGYFKRHVGNAAFYLKKPLGPPEDAAHQLTAFAEMLRGLKPLPGMRLLDFGAGTCWATRYFADFKLEVVACDVSPTALALGQQRFAHNPPVDSPFQPEFMAFNGRRLPLPDGFADRISCFDSFHRVPNPKEVLRELGRVLKAGGIAGFSEPGPRHSQTAQSQFEMKHYQVLENDTVLEEIWPWAQEAGFTDLRVAVFNTAPFTLSLAEFAKLESRPGSKPLQAYAEHVRRHAPERRLFFLHKGEPGAPDSRDRAALLGELSVELYTAQVHPGDWVEGRAVAHNTGRGRWLPSAAPFGPVKLGVHLKSADGLLIDADFARAELPAGRGTEPGETVAILFRFQAPAESGDYRLAFDLVSEDVCWFEANGARPVEAELAVR